MINEQQKQAISVLNRLHGQGPKAGELLTDEEYFMLMEYVFQERQIQITPYNPQPNHQDLQELGFLGCPLFSCIPEALHGTLSKGQAAPYLLRPRLLSLWTLSGASSLRSPGLRFPSVSPHHAPPHRPFLYQNHVEIHISKINNFISLFSVDNSELSDSEGLLWTKI